MTIQIGIYDFFAYTIPGGLYLSVLIYALVTFRVIAPNTVYHIWQDLTITHIVIFAALAYVTGLIFDPVQRRLWGRWFRFDESVKIAFDEVRHRYPTLEPRFEASQWYMLFTRIKFANSKIALDIERFNATSKMLRNISFALLLFALVQVVYLLQGYAWVLIVMVVFVALSVVVSQQAVRFSKWFYLSTFETIISMNLPAGSKLVMMRRTSSEIREGKGSLAESNAE